MGESILMAPRLEKARRACLGSSVMMAGPGRRGVRHRTVDDTAARAFDTSFAGRPRDDHYPEYAWNDP